MLINVLLLMVGISDPNSHTYDIIMVLIYDIYDNATGVTGTTLTHLFEAKGWSVNL